LVAPDVGDVVVGMPPTVELDGVVGGKPGLCRFSPGVVDNVVPAPRPGAGCVGSGEPGIAESVPVASGVAGSVVVSEELGVPLGLGDGATLTDDGVDATDDGVVGEPALVPPSVGVSCASVGARSLRTPGAGLVVAGRLRTRSPSGIPALAARGSATPDNAAAATAIN
jgi:hypothetical protein